ncbi:MAG TPA: carboxypeptidase-like regulatory domain-containing protein [Puia sp.]|nr:carboxypeptidase-like regulatory domain-containing protein [Puia sp.]
MKSFLLLLIFVLGQLSLQAQLFVQGRIMDHQTHEPLENAVIRVQNGRPTLSDVQGNFRLPVKHPGASLVVSYVGYRIVCLCAAE